MLRISLVQMNCEKAAIDANLESIRHYLADAQERGIDIVAFPEMSITGYADTDRYPQAILRLDGPEVTQFLELTRGNPATVLAGLIEENPLKKPFITQLVARDGILLGAYRKINIKDDEEMWFSPGEATPIFRHRPVNLWPGNLRRYRQRDGICCRRPAKGQDHLRAGRSRAVRGTGHPGLAIRVQLVERRMPEKPELLRQKI